METEKIWKLPLPSLVSVTKDVNEPRLPTLNGKTHETPQIEYRQRFFLELDPSEIGLKKDHPRVVRIGTPKLSRKVEMCEGSSIRRDGIDEIKKRVGTLSGRVNHE